MSLLRYSSGFPCGKFAGREKNLYLFFMLFLPLLHNLCMMGAKVVDNEKYLLVRIFDESFEEYCKKICVHSSFVNHVSKLPLIGE